MTYQLSTASVWDGSQWVAAAGGAGFGAGPGISSARDVIVTASTSAHIKGAWTQLIAANGAATDWLGVVVSGIGANGVNTATLIDIGVGAAGAETAVVSNVAVGGSTGIAFEFPLAIANGQRISARIQSVVTGGKTAIVSIQTFSTGIAAPTSVTTIGTSTATSEGTQFATANTWTQITSSTSAAYQYFVCVPSLTTTGVAPSASGTVDFGQGAAGSETVISRVSSGWTSSEQLFTYFSMLAVGAPAGTRLVGRSPIATHIDGCVIGVPYP